MSSDRYISLLKHKESFLKGKISESLKLLFKVPWHYNQKEMIFDQNPQSWVEWIAREKGLQRGSILFTINKLAHSFL